MVLVLGCGTLLDQRVFDFVVINSTLLYCMRCGGCVGVCDLDLHHFFVICFKNRTYARSRGRRQVAKAVLSGAKAGSLVLMDEMGSGTDPMQGAALAQSLLEVSNGTCSNSRWQPLF